MKSKYIAQNNDLLRKHCSLRSDAMSSVIFQPDYTALYPRRQYSSHIYVSENIEPKNLPLYHSFGTALFDFYYASRTRSWVPIWPRLGIRRAIPLLPHMTYVIKTREKLTLYIATVGDYHYYPYSPHSRALTVWKAADSRAAPC
jgi:hypothetical protein